MKSACQRFVSRRRILYGSRNINLLKPSGVAWRCRDLSTEESSDGSVLPPSPPLIEEETLPGYVADNYYPVEIGQVFDSKYRILCKLGYGTGSTVWLSKCLKDESYRALKVCTAESKGSVIQQSKNEMAVQEYLKSSPVQKHPGKASARTILNSFEISGPKGLHTCLTYQPQGMTFTELRNRLPEKRMDPLMLQGALQLIPMSLDYLHKNSIVHTDISPNNILCGVQDMSPFEELEKAEKAHASPRRVLPSRSIYLSRQMPITNGKPVLADLGSARFGQSEYQGDIMPLVYRAPEVILGMKWSSKVDVWSIGVMIWDLLEGKRLFLVNRDGINDDEQHLAEMVALLGAPPVKFLQQSENCSRYFDTSGNWLGSTPIPKTSLEERVTHLNGRDKELLLAFARRVLRWLPEERPTAEELIYDDWLMHRYATAESH